MKDGLVISCPSNKIRAGDYYMLTDTGKQVAKLLMKIEALEAYGCRW